MDSLPGLSLFLKYAQPVHKLSVFNFVNFKGIVCKCHLAQINNTIFTIN